MTTHEVYKQVWLALITDKTLTIKVDDPQTMANHAGNSIFSSAEMMPKPQVGSAVIAGIVPNSSRRVAPDVD